MRLKRTMTVVLAGILLVVGACVGAPTPPPVTTPPVTTPPVTTPAVTTPPVSTSTVTTPTPPPAVPGPNEVWILGRTFSPNKLTVAVGTEVIWISKDFNFHTVTSDTGLFGFGLAGGNGTYTFTEPGVYEYHCTLHQGMTGEVTVVGSTNITANQTKE